MRSSPTSVCLLPFRPQESHVFWMSGHKRRRYATHFQLQELGTTRDTTFDHIRGKAITRNAASQQVLPAYRDL